MSVLGILGSIAPTIAGLLPGPLGAMAKTAVTSLLGLKPDASEAEIEKTLATANPDMLLKLKQLDADFSEKMKQLDIDYEKMSYEDTANARAREIALKDRTNKILAYMIIGGYLAVQAAVMWLTPPAANHDLIIEGLSILKYSVVLVLGYYFGSSAGSKNKDSLINKMTNK